LFIGDVKNITIVFGLLEFGTAFLKILGPLKIIF